MKHTRFISRILLVMMLVSIIAGCGVLPDRQSNQPPGPADQTATMVAIGTQAYYTAMAVFTEVSFLTPSATPTIFRSPTPEPTEGSSPTPTVSPTPTATLYSLPTWTPTPIFTATQPVTPGTTPGTGFGTPTVSPTPKAYSCIVVGQSPKDATTMKPKNDFDVKWTVKNNGTKEWNDANVDYRYLSGTEMQKIDLYDLPKDVAVGDTVELVVDMISPARDGIYTTYWELVMKDTQICKFYLTIVVKKP